MKRSIATMIAVLAVATLSLVWSPAAAAQALTSGPQQITLNVTVQESLTLACTPTTVTLSGAPGATLTASAPVSCTTNWNVGTARHSIAVYQYFTTPFPFGGTTTQPPSVFSSSVNGAAAAAFSGTSATNGGITGYFGPNLFAPTTFSTSGTNTSTTLLSVAGSSGLTPGSYSATLDIIAIVQ